MGPNQTDKLLHSKGNWKNKQTKKTKKKTKKNERTIYGMGENSLKPFFPFVEHGRIEPLRLTNMISGHIGTDGRQSLAFMF